ncbi:MAG: hypothetical protein P8Y96_11645 [Desulfuromonadales bacterium]|jgi:hypothetical protein
MIRSEQLANGLEIIFYDRSNRYFGDYHRICVVAAISLRFAAVIDTVDTAMLNQARRLFGDHLVIEKRIERMGVPTADRDQVRNALVDDFLKHSAAYLGRSDYPSRLLAAELKKHSLRRLHV